MGAADAYGQARLIDALVVREPPGSPELQQRIAEARAAFFALSSTGPDLPSMQAASMASTALDQLDMALRGEGAPPSSASPGPRESRVDEARDHLNHALALLRPLFDVATPPAPTGAPLAPR